MADELNIPGFKHYELDSTYQAKLAAGEVNAKDLSFVKETGKIYTQGGEYGGGGDGDYLEVRELKMNDDMTVTEEQKAYNAETLNKVLAGESVILSYNGIFFNKYLSVEDFFAFFVAYMPGSSDETFSELAISMESDGTVSLDILEKGTIDTAMSDDSKNAVQNKVVKAYIDDAVANAGGGGVSEDYVNTAIANAITTTLNTAV